MGDEGQERANLSRLLWLGQRMDAKRRPITDAQVGRFGRHPAGPILPDLCLETRRLPWKYGTSFEGRKMPPVLALSVTPGGEPCVGTIVNCQPTVFRENMVYEPGEAEKAVPDGTTMCDSMRILGFREFEPVVEVTSHFEGPTDPAPVSYASVFDGDVPNAEGVTAATVLQGGSLVYEVRPFDPKKKNWPHKVFWKGELVNSNASRSLAYRKFFLAPDGRLAGLFYDAAVGYGACYVDDEKPIGLHSSYPGPMDVLETETSFFWVAPEWKQGKPPELLGHILFVTDKKLRPRKGRPMESLGENLYRSHLTELNNGRLAFIGESTRDKLECWVVDGKEQPGFDRVSPLFEEDHWWYYWGAVGRHLCLMEIPR